uniref:Xylulose kinase-1 n=1 Tax=Tanacetum cinerariifolium TaxID=118510 RepID=A0A699IE83_TANCI|nr:hypothetical protein [Tanacetum cinerariifolium]
MSTPKFSETHNLVAFLEKPTESEGFEQIIDFLNANPIKYALTVNPIIYTSCIKQFWATTKVNTVNGEEKIQALMDKKNVIITETNVRSDLQLEDDEGTECLPNATIFKQLTLMSAKTTAWNEFSSTMASAIIYLATNQKFNFSKYIFDNMRKKKPRKIRRKDTELPQTSVPIEVVADEAVYEEMYDSVERAATTATGLDEEHDRGIISKTQFTATLNEPSSIGTSSGSRPRRQETMRDATAQTRVLALETIKTNQALEIRSLKRRVKKLEKKAIKRTHKLNRLYKISSSRRIESSDEASLGDQKDASKQERIIDNLDADEGVTLVDETHGRNDQDMFDTGVLDDEELMAEKEVSTANPVTTAGEVVTTASAKVSDAATTPTISMNDITLAKALDALKSAKPMVKEPSVPVSAASTSLKVSAVSTTSTTVTTTIKAKGIVMQEPEETTIRTTIVPSQSLKDKGKPKMIKVEKPLKKKDQIMINEEVARNLEAQLQAELEEEERIARQKEEEANIALLAE